MKSITIGHETYAHNTEVTKLNKYPINRFKPFDKVLVRNNTDHFWNIEFFSKYNNLYSNFEFFGLNNTYEQCVPYNEETKHLLGTKQKAPEFYINWEEE